MATVAQIDFDFLAKHEGTNLKAYVPVCTLKSTKNKNSPVCYKKAVGTVIGNSGVTIATGLDLGQQNEKGLRNMKIPEDIIKAFRPYLGLHKDDAKKKIEELPFSITSQQERIINEKVKASYIDKLRIRYNSNSKTDFFDLPSEAQTAIFSFYYQNGWKADNTFHKKFYDAVIKQNWNEASIVLNSATEYKNRRSEEATLFSKIKPVSEYVSPTNILP